MIDTHAHLDACVEPAEVILGRARDAGVNRLITIGTGVESARTSLEIAGRERGVYVSLGIHPHDAGDVGPADLAALAELLGHERAVAVGETGLDFYRDYAPHDAQRRLFEAHLGLAAELHLPVVIHSRAAAAATADLLASFDGIVVLHCFSDPALLPAALDRRYYVSFAGNVTYPKAEALREAAALIPDDRLLAETDCPYLSPQAVRGRPCEPAFVMHTMAVLAEVRGVMVADLVGQIDANASRAFSLP